MLKKDSIHLRDPFIVPVHEKKKYYLFGTTDKNMWNGICTGFDVYVSEDLENWEGPKPAFRASSDFWADQNFWAPEVHCYGDKYYMLASFKREGVSRGTQILVSKEPAGPYVPLTDGPITPKEWECLDGTLYIDEESEPWIVFCHEWAQVNDGEICGMKLSRELTATVGEPILLFHASDAPWSYQSTATSFLNDKGQYVTDGPFLYKASNGELLMLWSSYTHKEYAIGIARSKSGKITGPWIHDTKPLGLKDGGHGMIFKTFNGELMLTVHTPNVFPYERPIFIPLKDENGKLHIIN
jgi:beta-xylosidase